MDEETRNITKRNTYVMKPSQLVRLWIRLHGTFEVDVVAFLYVVRIKVRSYFEGDKRGVWKKKYVT